MERKTITFKCDICGRKLTFYKANYSHDGCSCPICDPLGYKPILKPISYDLFQGKNAVLKTRKLYEEQSKKWWAEHPNGISLKDVLNE